MPSPIFTSIPIFDPANAPVWHPSIVADLAELLAHPDAQWGDIEELLAELPVESGYARLLRGTQASRALPNFFFGQSPSTNFTLDEDARQILLFRILPYATLLDNKLTPLQQVTQLRHLNIDVEHFCTWVQAFDSIYAEAARTALQAWKDHYSLLRGSKRAPEPNNQLLRPALETNKDMDTLLQASAPPASEPNPAKRGLLRRFLRKP